MRSGWLVVISSLAHGSYLAVYRTHQQPEAVLSWCLLLVLREVLCDGDNLRPC